MGKAPDAFRTISEVAEWLDVAPHVLRFWESKFTQVKPVKRAGGRRYYRPSDMEILGGIKVLLHEEGQTIKAVQSLISELGIEAVVAKSPDIDDVENPLEVIEGNVVAFEPSSAETTDVQETPPQPVAAPDPAPEPGVAKVDAPTPADAPAPKPRIIEIPEIAGDMPDDAARPLSALGLVLTTDAATRATKTDRIAPMIARLQALRAQMKTHGAR